MRAMPVCFQTRQFFPGLNPQSAYTIMMETPTAQAKSAQNGGTAGFTINAKPLTSGDLFVPNDPSNPVERVALFPVCL
jgi:hypothetical protein